VQEPIHVFFGVALLLAPNRRAAYAGPTRHFENGQSIGRVQHNAGALYVFERPASISTNRGQARAFRSGDDHRNGLSHAFRFARSAAFVNPMSVSVH
jgi:hypothetical protein